MGRGFVLGFVDCFFRFELFGGFVVESIVECFVCYGVYLEFIWFVVFVGWVIGIVIVLLIGYLSLKFGFLIEGLEFVVIFGFGILCGLMGCSSIIENNIN